jgi:hypothetical protein
MIAAPGVARSGPSKPFTDDEGEIAKSLRDHAAVIASREHNIFRLPMLEQAAQYIENAFDKSGYSVATQRFMSGPAEVRNIEVEVKGESRASGIVMPALMVTDTAPYRYPHDHTPQDTPDRVNYERLARVVTGLHRALRAVSQAE